MKAIRTLKDSPFTLIPSFASESSFEWRELKLWEKRIFQAPPKLQRLVRVLWLDRASQRQVHSIYCARPYQGNGAWSRDPIFKRGICVFCFPCIESNPTEWYLRMPGYLLLTHTIINELWINAALWAYSLFQTPHHNRSYFSIQIWLNIKYEYH